MAKYFDLLLNRAGAAASLVFGFTTMIPVIRGSGWSSPLMTMLALPDRLNVLLHLSIVTAICHGVVWLLTERTAGWRYGVGPRTANGIPGMILSLSLTIPAVIVPVVYQTLVGRPIVPPRHAYGAILCLVGGAAAYVILFGSGKRSFPGIRASILKALAATPVRGEVLATAAYAGVLIPLVAVPYRLVVYRTTPASSSQFALFVGAPLRAAVFTFGCIAAYVLVVQPSAKLLRESAWIHVRGIVAGMTTVVATCVALYT